MDKKYQKDTPVTLEMLAEILRKATYFGIKSVVDSMIEPPKPEPKEGEWWLCRCDRNGAVLPLLRQKGWWCGTGCAVPFDSDNNITTLYKMVPAKEGE